MKHKLNKVTESGKIASPRLEDGVVNFLIDIDGTICEDVPNEEPDRMLTAEVFEGALEQINAWYAQGHVITFFTSRTEEHRQVTIDWLNNTGFKYHNLLCGKPRGGNYHWIDNHEVKATQYKGKFSEMVKKKKTIHVFKE